MKIEIEVPDTFTVESREQTVTVNLAALVKAGHAQAVIGDHVADAFGKVIIDAGSGAALAAGKVKLGESTLSTDGAFQTWKVSADGKAAIAEMTGVQMSKRIDAWMSGAWGATRSAGIGGGIRTLAILRIYKDAMPVDKVKAFNKLALSDQVAKALANEAKIDATRIEAEIAKIEAERQARADEKEARRNAASDLAADMDFDF